MEENEKNNAINALRMEILDIEKKNLKSKSHTDSAMVAEISKSIIDKSKFL